MSTRRLAIDARVSDPRATPGAASGRRRFGAAARMLGDGRPTRCAAFGPSQRTVRTMPSSRQKAPPDLPGVAQQARRFGKARAAQSHAVMEDYAELISDLIGAEGEARATDIARRLGVSHATAIKHLSRMKREGLVTARPYRGVFLTDAGQALAQRVRQRHRLVVDLLIAVGVPRETAEADAEGIEHHVSDVALAAFARFLAAREG